MVDFPGARLGRVLNRKSIPTADTRSRRIRHKIRLLVAFAILGVIAILASAYYIAGGKLSAFPIVDGKRPGNELKTDQVPYGWYTSKDVGTIFTDGLNLLSVTPKARGPLRLISAKPLMDNGPTVRVIGVLARINPEMLPPGSKVGSFQEAPGFPPRLPHTSGAVPIDGLIVHPPKPGEDRWIELQIGYEVVAQGRSARRGIELIYEYEGSERKAFIPSYVSVCAPSTATCEPEYDK